jgi:uncharacterized membrane protein YbhN (UPF0104 family)
MTLLLPVRTVARESWLGSNKVGPTLFVSATLLAATLAFVWFKGDLSRIGELLGAIDPITMTLVILLQVVGLMLGGARMTSLLRGLNHRLPLLTSFRIVALSQAAANIFFQIFGQLGSRTLLLDRHGVPASATVLVTLVERVIGLGLLLPTAIVGALYVFGGVSLDLSSGGADLLSLLFGLSVAVAAGVIPHMRQALNVQPDLFTQTKPVMQQLLGATLTTFLIQLATLIAFTLATRTFTPETPWMALVAANTVVMLAAALPISFAGWGLRELGAVASLGAIGVPAEAALAGAVALGITSLIAITIVGLLPESVEPMASKGANRPVQTSGTINADVALGWGLSLAVAILILFQVHVPTGSGKINVNLADPVVIVAGVLASLHVVHGRIGWRIGGLGLHAASAFAAIALAYLIGWLNFGSNAWAMTKLIGFPILCAYFLTGALVVAVGGAHGREFLLRTLAAAYLGVASLFLIQVLLWNMGVISVASGGRIQGYAGDPNAFALQSIIVLITVLVMGDGWRVHRFTIGVCFCAIWLSGSRAGLLSLFISLAFLLIIDRRLWRRVTQGAIGACGALVLLEVIYASALLLGANIVAYDPMLSDRGFSNRERWSTYLNALQLMLESPIFGAGLGAFVENFRRPDGSPLVIHSSYLWILTEIGIPGLLAFGAAVLRLGLGAKREMQTTAEWRLVAGILLAWLVFSLTHDMAYQRMPWFALGACLAVGIGSCNQASRIAN